MKRFLLISALLLCLPLSSRADDTTKRAKVQEMFDVIHMDRLMSQTMDAVMKQMTTMTDQMIGSDLSPEKKAKMAAFQARVLQAIEEQVGWKAMEPALVTLYAQTYTEDELDAILVFYKSPAGRSMLEKMPQLTAQSMQLSQQRLVAMQPQLKQMIDEFAKDMDQTSTQTSAERKNSAK